MIFSDLLSALQVLEKLKTDNLLFIQILQDILHKIDVDQKETVFIMWGFWTADRTAEEAHNKEPTDHLMLSLKPLTAKLIHPVWQKEWAESVRVSNKLHELLPNFSDKLLSFCNTRGKKTLF